MNHTFTYKPIKTIMVEHRLKRSQPAEFIASRVEIPLEKVHEIQDAYWGEYAETLE